MVPRQFHADAVALIPPIHVVRSPSARSGMGGRDAGVVGRDSAIYQLGTPINTASSVPDLEAELPL